MSDAPPRGELFQEALREEPFWMLVACSLVNLTTWEQARPAFLEVRRRYAGPEDLAHLDEAEGAWLEETLRPLGLWRRRAKSLVAMARYWTRHPPVTADDVRPIPGCGRYAADSWAIFVEGRTDVAPDDGKLQWYLTERRRTDVDRGPEGAERGPQGGGGAPGDVAGYLAGVEGRGGALAEDWTPGDVAVRVRVVRPGPLLRRHRRSRGHTRDPEQG